MHQHPRPSPRSSSAASNPTTNPERTNNSRDRPPQRTRSSVDLASYTERAAADTSGDVTRRESSSSEQDRESTKLNQIIQHFHSKAALTICSSRANLPQVVNKYNDVKQNRWFNVILNDTDVLLDDLQPWRRSDLSENKPPPLVIEVYVDTSHLSQSQALVIMDETGKRWDVVDSLASSADSSPRQNRNGGRLCEVVLERWTIELGDSDGYPISELNDALPNVYKKGVVMFRSLYSFARLLPAWKLHRKLTRPGSHQSLRLRFRIKQGHSTAYGRQDSLYAPLCPSDHESDAVVERYRIPPLLCRSGPLSIAVDYRTNCDFNVADSEALLSSRFLGLDQGVPTIPAAGRSLPGARSEQSRVQYSSLVGGAADERARIGAYGSLGTFHATDKRASPVTELKQRVLDSDKDDMQRPKSDRGDDSGRGTPLSLVNNPPFKAGSLASSPRPSPSPSTSLGRAESSLSRLASTSSGKRVSLNTLPQQALRGPPIPSETAIASSGSSSPKPAPVHRYSSSFANRNKRFTSQGSKTGESNVSSGRGSSSSTKERSGQLNEGTPGSSGSGQTDEMDIASFIYQVESAKDLPSFHTRPVSRENTINLAKYSGKISGQAQLDDAMSSSSLLQTSGTPPSRRLSNVPGLSTSSSPSRALPHAPFVRSRLSTHSIAEEVTGASGTSGGSDSPKIHEEDEEEDEEPFIFPQDNV